MRDRADNCVIICSIENVDPMGVHTGDSITVAPAQTLTDVEYQQMRDAAFACIRRVGVETGGSNVQFAVNPDTGDMVVIEMNPRVSRSPALASKATGFPIAKIAAKLAVGYTLDEIPNDITKMTPASFEPSIDYVVTKIPRWAFEKLPGTSGCSARRCSRWARRWHRPHVPREPAEGPALARAGPPRPRLRPGRGSSRPSDDDLLAGGDPHARPDPAGRRAAAPRRHGRPDVHAATKIDPWFLDQMSLITDERHALAEIGLDRHDRTAWRRAKRLGFGDAQLAYLWEHRRDDGARCPRGRRRAADLQDRRHLRRRVRGPHAVPLQHLRGRERGPSRATGRSVVILGSGPNRIGQGIEFDYCCVHASFALRDAGFETVMVNCNPETVSTDYDTSDRLYFEPLT
jgi:carbamoyl-phosphate synthase large subunit